MAQDSPRAATSQNGRWHALAAYFLRPFPKAEGFSPYRTPGLVVHIPVVALCVGLAVLVWGDRLAWWVIAVHLVVGVYLGRDAAIFAHYNPLITLTVWVVLFASIVVTSTLVRWAQALNGALPVAPWLVTVACVLLLLADAWWWGRDDSRPS